MTLPAEEGNKVEKDKRTPEVAQVEGGNSIGKLSNNQQIEARHQQQPPTITGVSRIARSRTSIGLTKVYLTIPLERVGIAVGRNGETLKKIMDETRTKITVDSVNGVVVIEPASPYTSPYDIMKAQDVLKAIGYGFSPEKAFRLLDEDAVLIVIDLTQHVKDSENHLIRIKGRIIGENGKARKNIEEMTDTYISIYGDYVAIIGSYENANIAREAIMMLIEGRQHSTVYRHIERLMRHVKRSQITKLWGKSL